MIVELAPQHDELTLLSTPSPAPGTPIRSRCSARTSSTGA